MTVGLVKCVRLEVTLVAYDHLQDLPRKAGGTEVRRLQGRRIQHKRTKVKQKARKRTEMNLVPGNQESERRMHHCPFNTY